jgi:hypothetical protein
MRFKTTATTAKLIDDLNRLGAEIEPRLDEVSAAARGEWRELRSRFPTPHDLERGFMAMSDEDLAVMRAKVMRFRDFLGMRRIGSGPISTRAGTPVVVLDARVRS